MTSETDDYLSTSPFFSFHIFELFSQCTHSGGKNDVVCVVGGSRSRVCVWDLYPGGFATLIVNPDFRR